MRSAVFVCTIVAAIAAAAPARAAPVATGAATPAVSGELLKEYQAGVDSYRLGKYDDAHAHLARAEALDPKLPGPHRFLAAVASARHQWADCITESRRALQLNPRSQEVDDTRKLHDQCRAAAGRPPFRSALGDSAAIAVTANVTGAIVRIEGLRYGGTPIAPRRIKPGVHDVVVVMPGYKPAYRTIDTLPGIVTDVDVILDPDPAASAQR